MGCLNLKTVVVIDDDQNFIAHLSSMLKHYPELSVIASANSGKEGRFAIEHYRPDLVVLDIMMHDDDGLKVIKHIREKCGQYNPYIYIVTAVSTQLVQDILIDLKVDFYDFKPIDNEQLAERLDYFTDMTPKKSDEYISDSENGAAGIVDSVIAEFEIPSHLLGHNYIKTALYFMIDNPSLKRDIYSKVADVFKCSNRSILNAVKKAIEACMTSKAYRAEFGNVRVENLIFLNQLCLIVRNRLRG